MGTLLTRLVCNNWSFIPSVHVAEAWACYLISPLLSLAHPDVHLTLFRTIMDWPKEGTGESSIGLLSHPLSTFKLQSQVLQVDADWQGDEDQQRSLLAQSCEFYHLPFFNYAASPAGTLWILVDMGFRWNLQCHSSATSWHACSVIYWSCMAKTLSTARDWTESPACMVTLNRYAVKPLYTIGNQHFALIARCPSRASNWW